MKIWFIVGFIAFTFTMFSTYIPYFRKFENREMHVVTQIALCIVCVLLGWISLGISIITFIGLYDELWKK